MRAAGVRKGKQDMENERLLVNMEKGSTALRAIFPWRVYFGTLYHVDFSIAGRRKAGIGFIPRIRISGGFGDRMNFCSVNTITIRS